METEKSPVTTKIRNFLLTAKFVIPMGVVVLLTSGYMWQARTTIEGEGPGSLCYHAHFTGHVNSHGRLYDDNGEFVKEVKLRESRGRDFNVNFIRHYHKSNPLGACEHRTLNAQGWSVHYNLSNGRGHRVLGLGFVFYAYDTPTTVWPRESGVYLLVQHTESQRFPVYVAYTEDLRQGLQKPDGHTMAECFREHGVTHIHALRDEPDLNGDEVVRGFIRLHDPPCNDPGAL